MSKSFFGQRSASHSPGFTMIELLMVIILIGILVAVALPQFLDFRQEARVAAATQLAQAVVTGIKLQHKQAILRCNSSAQTFLPLESIEQNDVTAGVGATCTTAQLPNEADRKIFDGPIGLFPTNPVTGLRTIGFPSTLNPGESYSENGTCSASDAGTTYGWCYNPTTGDFFSATDRTGGGLINVTSEEAIAPDVFGCTDPTDPNYNPSANQDDGSCFNGSCPDPQNLRDACLYAGLGNGTWNWNTCTCTCPGNTHDGNTTGCQCADSNMIWDGTICHW